MITLRYWDRFTRKAFMYQRARGRMIARWQRLPNGAVLIIQA